MLLIIQDEDEVTLFLILVYLVPLKPRNAGITLIQWKRPDVEITHPASTRHTWPPIITLHDNRIILIYLFFLLSLMPHFHSHCLPFSMSSVFLFDALKATAFCFISHYKFTTQQAQYSCYELMIRWTFLHFFLKLSGTISFMKHIIIKKALFFLFF